MARTLPDFVNFAHQEGIDQALFIVFVVATAWAWASSTAPSTPLLPATHPPSGAPTDHADLNAFRHTTLRHGPPGRSDN
ncbi:hypothetical protein ACFW81_07240 [Streptomyces angustmyceticus]|uniref:hypothetical protein n=1 Tax=Streptomyces angustmyceticus TaxID=285578 RepID=UPI0036B02479